MEPETRVCDDEACEAEPAQREKAETRVFAHPDQVVYKHSDKLRSRNRRAQAKYREKQKSKFTSQDSLVAELARMCSQLQTERAGFAAQKQAWRSLLKQQQQQQSQQIAQLIAPDASTLVVSSEDTYLVACSKTPGTGAVLDIAYAMRCLVADTLRWPVPDRDEVINCRLDQLFEPNKQHQMALTHILDNLEASSSPKAHRQLEEYSSLHCALRKALGWNYMTAGNDFARLVDNIWTQAGIRQFGLPPADHWQRAAARLKLTLDQSAKIIALRLHFLERRHRARRQITSLPQRVQAFVLDQPADASSAYETAANEGVHCHEQLLQCLNDDHQALSDFLFGVREQVLTPFQDAVLLQAAWPYKLDLMAVSLAVADLAASHVTMRQQHATMGGFEAALDDPLPTAGCSIIAQNWRSQPGAAPQQRQPHAVITEIADPTPDPNPPPPNSRQPDSSFFLQQDETGQPLTTLQPNMQDRPQTLQSMHRLSAEQLPATAARTAQDGSAAQGSGEVPLLGSLPVQMPDYELTGLMDADVPDNWLNWLCNDGSV